MTDRAEPPGLHGTNDLPAATPLRADAPRARGQRMGSPGSEKTAATRLRRELIAKPWSGEADEGAGALGQVQPVKIDAAVLSHHPVHVGAGGRHGGAGGQGRDDA